MRLSYHNILALLLLLLVVLVVGACTNQISAYPADLPHGAYYPDSVFSDFYLENGGYKVFRHAISTPYSNQRGEKFQFYETVLMVYDPIEDRIYFDDLGKQLDARNLPVQDWDGLVSPEGLMVGNIYILPAFVPLYIELGPELVGQPLTQPYINYSKNRMEQHFSNLGLYYNLDDPEQTAGLLNYGAVACESCNHLDTAGSEGIIDVPMSLPAYENMDDLAISISLTGQILEGPIPVRDGTTELVFEYMAFYEENGHFKIRSVPVELELMDSFLYHPLDSPSFEFYEIKNGIGHNVFFLFAKYVRENGGYQVSGKPITEIIEPSPGLQAVRQCFENYCLDYFPHEEANQVRPASLGDQYLAKASANYIKEPKSLVNAKDDLEFSSRPRNLSPFTLLLWEKHTVIDSSTQQTISVRVELEDTPQSGKELILTVTYPDGTEEDVLMPATNWEGVTSFTLNPIAGNNGDLVHYQVCLYVQEMDPACVQQTFLIWGNP